MQAICFAICVIVTILVTHSLAMCYAYTRTGQPVRFCGTMHAVPSAMFIYAPNVLYIYSLFTRGNMYRVKPRGPGRETAQS